MTKATKPRRAARRVQASVGLREQNAISEYRHPITGERVRKLKDGEPCKHPGCAHHMKHPCEVCGRTLARGEAWAPTRDQKQEQKQSNNKHEVRDE